MSENKNLSIDEIIKRAEQIKAEAERQLVSAEESLAEKAKAAKQEIVVDENEVAKRIAEAVKADEPEEEEEDVKEYVPPKKEAVKLFSLKKKTETPDDSEDDGDIKIVPEPFDEEEPVADEEAPAPLEDEAADGKTKSISLEKKEQTKILPDSLEGTKVIEPKKREEEKTRTVTFVTSNPDEAEDEADDGLEKIPTIVSKENLVSAFSAETESPFEEETGVQITFEGFDEATDEVEKIDEEAAERELEQRRREKVGKFRLFGPDETDASLGNNVEVDDDYESENEKDSFIESLIDKKRNIRIRTLVTGILGLVLIFMTALKDTTYMPYALTSHKAYFMTALIIYVLVLIANFNIILRGFNFKRKLNFDFPVALTSIGILVHTAVLLSSRAIWLDGGVLLAGAGAFSLCLSQIGKLKMMSRIVDNFEFITSPGDKYTVENITNGIDAEVISRGMLDDEPRLKMSVKTDFPNNFLEISCKNEPADRISVRLFIIDVILCAGLYFAVGLIDNFNTALNAALCALAISLPSSALILTNAQLCDISSQLKDYGSRVCGFEGAVMASSANAVVMEAADLFNKESCGLHGIKTFDKAKVDDAIIKAAAVIVKTNSPLRHVFDDVIIGQQSILPPVEDVTYEERLGTSAWIYDKKILVGTRELLQHHSVKVPKQSFEEKYTYRGRKALYLAVDGKINAMFIVSYSADKELSRELRKLEKNDIAVIVKSSDPYITEDSLAELFDLPAGFIRVMNASAARAFEKYSALEVEKSPAYVVHDGSAIGLIGAMRGAEIIVGSRGLISFLCAFGCLFGFAAIAALSFIKADQLSALGIMIYQSVWTCFMYAVMKLKGLGL